MYRLFFSLLLGIIFTTQNDLRAQTTSTSENDLFKKEFLMMWDRSEAYSLEMLSSAGDSLLTFKPEETMQSFGELFLHMAQTIRALSSGFIDAETVLAIPRSARDLSNEDLQQITVKAYDHVRKLVNKLDDEALNEQITFFSGDTFSRRHIFRVLHAHNLHHRAQCATYLRISGQIPPRFIGW